MAVKKTPGIGMDAAEDNRKLQNTGIAVRTPR